MADQRAVKVICFSGYFSSLLQRIFSEIALGKFWQLLLRSLYLIGVQGWSRTNWSAIWILHTSSFHVLFSHLFICCLKLVPYQIQICMCQRRAESDCGQKICTANCIENHNKKNSKKFYTTFSTCIIFSKKFVLMTIFFEKIYVENLST